MSSASRQRMQDEQARAYRGAVEIVEKRLGTSLPRFRGVEFCLADYEKPRDLGQAPYYRRYPGLTAKPYWEASAWPAEGRAILERFESEERALRDEFEASIAATRGDFRGQRTGYYGVADRWLSYTLVEESGHPVPEAFAAYPKLAGLLAGLVAQRLPCKTYFALMLPGVHLPEHCGGQNIALRMHLALRIPRGDAALRVGGVEHRWQNGKTVFFDDTFVHEAWNRTEEDRYILLMRILHPELSPMEREAYFLVEEAFRSSPRYLALKAEIDAEKAGVPTIDLASTVVSPTSPWVLDPRQPMAPFFSTSPSKVARSGGVAAHASGGLPRPRTPSAGQLYAAPASRWLTVRPQGAEGGRRTR